MNNTDIVICGAGIAGIATAYYLSTRYGRKDIVLVDRQQPLSYTSSKSGENYRDYWPQTCMAEFSGRSIELMESLAEETGNAFELSQSGYDFVSLQRGREIFPSEHLRQETQSENLRQIIDPELIRSRCPYLADNVEQLVHISNAGAFDVNALGMMLLARARQAGVRLKIAHITNVSRQQNGFQLDTEHGESLQARELILAGGPMNRRLAAMLGVEMNIRSFLQRKFVMPDPLSIIPRDMPFTVFADPQFLDWSDDERNLIASDEEYRWLLEEFPAGLHIKPESRGQIKLGWAFNRQAGEPQWQLADDVDFPNIALRGATRIIPGLAAYLEQIPTPVVQFAGYYTRTPENWPIIGPLEEHPGLFTVAALAGYGTMAACAAGELAAMWVMNEPLPEYARNFHRNRYDDPDIMAAISAIESDGQL